MRSNRGFTLIEILVAMAILGILVAVALPNYTDYVTRGKFPEATANLALKRVQLEQYYQDNRTYVGANACTSDTTTSRYFDFSCSVGPTTSTYTLSAVGKSTMAGFTFTLNQTNTKATSVVPSGWTTTTNCWATGKGGC